MRQAARWMYLPTILTMTMRLESLKPSQRKKGRFLLTLEDGIFLRVTEEEILRFRLREGQELDEDTLAALKKSADASRTKVTAANMIAARPLSKKELQKRLVQKGSDAEHAEAAVEWLQDLGAVNDAAYASSLVRHYSSRGYGKMRIREELHRRGVPKELWEEALEELPDSGETLDALIQKKSRGDLSDPKERKRLCDALLRRGFSWSEVRAALGRYIDTDSVSELPEE